MRVFAIDPGYTSSAYVLLECDDVAVTGPPRAPKVLEHDYVDTETMIARILAFARDQRIQFAIEQIESMGMAVGREVLETVRISGRFEQAWVGAAAQHWVGGCNRPARLITRRAVKLTLCGSSRAKDTNVRQALIDRYGTTRAAAVGNKKTPGPLYGISGHKWAALAVGVVGVTFLQQLAKE